MQFYEAAAQRRRNLRSGNRASRRSATASPNFLYRGILEIRISPSRDLELASRLSFFLWNTGPDQELLTLASLGV
jgi:hypothetical protein